MSTTDLGITHRRLNGRSAFHRDVPEIIRNFFSGPTGFASTVGKIMPEVVKTKISDEVPLFMNGLSLRKIPVVALRMAGGQLPILTMLLEQLWISR